MVTFGQPGLPPENTWPAWMVHAAKDIGVRELPGKEVHPRIAKFYTHTRLGGAPNDDDTAWCSAAMCCWMEESGFRSTRSAKARSWLDWGLELETPQVGCLVIFPREGSKGHVAFWGCEVNQGKALTLGGNQHNSVRFDATYDANSALGFRWPRGEDRLVK